MPVRLAVPSGARHATADADCRYAGNAAAGPPGRDHTHATATAHDRIGQGLRRGGQGLAAAGRGKKRNRRTRPRLRTHAPDEVRTRASQEADDRARQILVAAKAAAERDAQEARALAALLRHSLQPTPIRDYLQASLDILLTVVPWLAILPTGGIFLEEVALARRQAACA